MADFNPDVVWRRFAQLFPNETKAECGRKVGILLAHWEISLQTKDHEERRGFLEGLQGTFPHAVVLLRTALIRFDL